MKAIILSLLFLSIATQAQKVVLGCYYNQFVDLTVPANTQVSCAPQPSSSFNATVWDPGALMMSVQSSGIFDGYVIYDIDGLTCNKQYNLAFSGFLRIPKNETSITISWNGNPLRVYTSLDDPTMGGFYTIASGSAWTVTASCGNQIKYEYKNLLQSEASVVRNYIFHFYLW